MKMLITADLHLTSRDQDAYRFEFCEWLLECLDKVRADELAILGDLTEAKDCHDAALTNYIVGWLAEVAHAGIRVRVLRGNHDYLSDPTKPFFDFLRFTPKITYHAKPFQEDRWGLRFLWLPHTRNWQTDWAGVDFDADLIFAHQTVGGARGSNGHALDGVPSSIFPKGTPVWSGDVHVPQKIGPVQYVGSPYPIYFGDDFDSRVILLDTRNPKTHREIAVPSFCRKWVLKVRSVEDLERAGLQNHDHVRLILELPRSEFGVWQDHRRDLIEACEKLGVVVYGVELQERVGRVRLRRGAASPVARAVAPAELLSAFISHAGLTDELTIKVGKTLLES